MPLPVIKACSIESNQDLEILENYPATYFLVICQRVQSRHKTSRKHWIGVLLHLQASTIGKDYISWWVNS